MVIAKLVIKAQMIIVQIVTHVLMNQKFYIWEIV